MTNGITAALSPSASFRAKSSENWRRIKIARKTSAQQAANAGRGIGNPGESAHRLDIEAARVVQDISAARTNRSTRPHRSETSRRPVPRTREFGAGRSNAGLQTRSEAFASDCVLLNAKRLPPATK